MTARIVIEQIKALPPDERAKVIDVIAEVKLVQAVSTMNPRTFEESAKQIFDRHADVMDKLSQ